METLFTIAWNTQPNYAASITVLATACLEYLNYDRLGIKEVHRHLENGDTDLHRWLVDYQISPVARP